MQKVLLCFLAVAVLVSTSVSGKGGFSKPSLIDLALYYPRPGIFSPYYDIAKVAKLGSYFHKINNDKLNTCAIRLSYAFYQVGKIIDIDKNQCSDWSGERTTTSPRQKYIIRVKAFICYLRAKWGEPDITGSKQGEITGRGGVIAFENCDFDDAYGHVDVYTRNMKDCVNKCYFDRCKRFYLWKL